MYLVFMGESGNTGNSLSDPNQPHHIQVGLLVHESQSISINGEYNALYRRHFGRPPGEPGSSKGLRPADIYQGVGTFSSWTVAKRHELIQDCLNILIRRQVPAIIAYINKRDYAQSQANDDDPNLVWESPAEPVISRFLMALNMYLDELSLRGLDEQQIMNSAWPIKDFALVVAGDGRSLEPRFMDQFLKSEDGQDASGLLENMYFVGSDQSVGTQLANICAYFTRRWLQNPSAPHPYFDALRENEVVQVIYPVQL
jgi:hypothetical protein